MPSRRKSLKREIRALLHSLNRAWLEGRFSELPKYLHRNIVVWVPGSTPETTRGREAVIKSYRQFVENYSVRRYTESKFIVQSWGDTAVASYRFRILYEGKGKRYQDEGRDVFALVRERGKWRAVWRTIISPSGKT